MTTNIQSFAGDVEIPGNLQVKRLTVEDSITAFGANNAGHSNIGLVLSRQANTPNVAVYYDETTSELRIGHTFKGGNDTVMEIDSANNVTMNVFGDVECNFIRADGGLLSNIVSDLQSVTTYGSSTDRTVTLSNVTTGLVVDSNVVVAGNVTATAFIGDGSQLDGIAANFEEIIINGNVTSNTVEFRDSVTSLVTTGAVGVINTAPGHDLSVGANLYVEELGSNVLTVEGNVSAHKMTLGTIEITPAYSLQQVTGVGNSTSLTVQFANTSTGFVTTGMAGIGIAPLSSDVGVSGLHVDGHIRLGGAAGTDENQDLYVKSAAQLQIFGNDSDLDNSFVGAILRSGVSNAAYVNVLGAATDADYQHIAFGVKNSEKMRITGTGDVGIGTASPDNKLEIADHASRNPTLLKLTCQNPPGGVGSESNTAIQLLGTDGTTYGGYIEGYLAQNVGSGLKLGQIGGSGEKIEHIRITGGNVGIGTTSPAYKLDVSDTVYSRKGLAPGTISTSVTRSDSKFLFYDISSDNWSGMGSDSGGRFWLTTGTAGTRELFVMDSAGNVGIGTASPQDNLHIYADESGGTQLKIENQYDTGDSRAGLFLQTRSSNVFSLQYTPATESVVFDNKGMGGYAFYQKNAAGTTNHVVGIDKDGNVGIGTTSPASKLHVDNGVLVVRDTPETNTILLFPDGDGTGPSTNEHLIGNTHIGVAQFVSEQGDDASTIAIINKDAGDNTTKNASIGFFNTDTVGTGKYGGRIGFWPEDLNAVKQQFRIYTNPQITAGAGYELPVQRMVVTGDGNVGIGTTDPAHALDIVGNAYVSNKLFVQGFRIVANEYNGLQAVTDANNETSNTIIMSNVLQSTSQTTGALTVAGGVGIQKNLYCSSINASGSLTVSGGLSVDSDTFVVNSTSNRVGVNVGATPLHSLHVKGTGENPVVYVTDPSNDRYATGLGCHHVGGVGQRLDFYTGDSGANGTALSGSSFIRMCISAAGNVGVGTTDPQNRLHVRGAGEMVRVDDGARQIVIGCDANEPWFGTLGNNDVRFTTDNTERFRLKRSTGYLGIGTANPLSVLTVKSNYYGGVSSGFCLDATDGSVYNLRLSSYVQAVNQVGYKFTVNNIASTVDALNFGYNGNVGIGTASPQDKLNINGNIEHVWGDYRIGVVYRNDGGTNFRQGMAYDTGNRQLKIYSTSSDTGGDIGFYTRRNTTGTSDTDYGTERMRITGIGNVGIGTNNPAAKLHVKNGSIGFGYGHAIHVDPDLYAGWPSGTTKLIEVNYATGDEVRFFTPGSQSATQKMVINSAGNVGIGTATPATKFHVYDDATYDVRIRSTCKTSVVGTGSGTSLELVDNSGHGGFVEGVHNANVTHGLRLGGYSNGARDAPALYIRGGNRYIGFGISEPQSRMHHKQAADQSYSSATLSSYQNGAIFERANTADRWTFAQDDVGSMCFFYNTARRGYLLTTGTDSNVNFTGQHRTFVKDVPFTEAASLEGLIVSADQNKYIKMSGGVEAGSNAITVNESLPIVSLCTKVNDKKCFGVISASEDPDKRQEKHGNFVSDQEKELGDTRVYINSVGEGAIWVTNINGSLESGDYITTSNVAGYGQKQDDDILHNYTVAKITMDCDFEPATQPIQIIKKELANVNYWVKTTYTNVSLEEYSKLSDENRTTEEDTYYTKDVERKYMQKPVVTVTAEDPWDDVSVFPSDVTYAQYLNLGANVQNRYTLTYTRNDFESVHYEKTTVSNVTSEDAWDAVHIEPPTITYAEYSNLEANVQNTYTLTYTKSVTTTTNSVPVEEKELYTPVYVKTVTETVDADTEGADAHARTIYKKIVREETKEQRDDEEWSLDVRQELVNVLDAHGQLQWEDTDQTEKAYKIRYLDASGAITDEANAVHIAAFVGCTYHCG